MDQTPGALTVSAGANLFDHPSRGHTLHLRYMHYDLDPASSHYLDHCHIPADKPDPSGRYILGAHRTPLGETARNTFLWRPLSSVNWSMDTKDVATVIKDLYRRAEKQIQRTENLMIAVGDFFQPLDLDAVRGLLGLRNKVRASPFTPDDILITPIWQLSTASYFQLAYRIPYLRQVQALVLACNIPQQRGGGFEGMSQDLSLREAVLALQADLLEDTHLLDLDATVKRAEGFKTSADLFMSVNNRRSAIAMYVHSIRELLPWFPSEYHMAPWEARLNGVGSLLVKCNINIVIALWEMEFFKSAFHIAEAASTLACVTNREKAKILFYQGMSVYEIEENKSIKAHEWDFNLSKFPTNYQHYQDQVKVYQSRLPDEFANPPCIYEYHPEEFAEHHREVVVRVGDRADKWWEKEESVEAVNVKNWLAKMGRVRGLIDHEKDKDFLVDGEYRHLEKQNEEFGRTGHGLWEYRGTWIVGV